MREKCRYRTVPCMLGARDYGAGSGPLRAHDFAGYRVADRSSWVAITERCRTGVVGHQWRRTWAFGNAKRAV
jgi:hypothetical protein